MKSAYELAMERLSKSAPTVKLSDQQRKELAEVDSVYAAKIAEREIFLNGQIAKASAQGDVDALQQLNRQLASDRKNLQADLEEKKEKIRQGGS
jgi:hypothetical protein